MIKVIFLFIIPFSAQALITPPSSVPMERTYALHPDHVSIDELKNQPAQPFFISPQQRQGESHILHNQNTQEEYPYILYNQTIQGESPHILHNQNTQEEYPYILYNQPLPLLKNDPAVKESSRNLCYEGFAEKTGAELIEHIRSSDDEGCLYHLFSKAPKNIRIAAFRMQNLISVAREAQPLALEYKGLGNDFLRKLFIFLREGYYNYFYHKEDLDWSESKETIDTAAVSAAQAFINNSNFYNVNSEHGKVLAEVLILTDSMEKQAHFLPDYIAYLNQVDRRYAEEDHYAMRRAVNAIFVALFRGHNQRPEFHSAITNNIEIIDALKNFAFSEWALEPEFIWLAANAALELSRFLQYDGTDTYSPRIAVYDHLIEAVRDIVNRYRNHEEGMRIFISALNNILFFEKCQAYNVCGVEQNIERQVLNKTHRCSVSSNSTAVIRTQNLTEEQLSNICTLIMEEDNYFHEKLMTNNMPLQNDYNETIEVIVFDKPASYQTYSFLFFGNSTNNGGIYLEGDPSNPSNTARFITYLADWIPSRPVWNLEHEYVHYLDGRYNLQGNFGDYKTSTHKTVWWLEGLAEYISKKDKHGWAFSLLQSDTPPQLSFIFDTNYSSGAELVYPWSYLAVRFMFERHPQEVQAFLNNFRGGLYEDYKNYIEYIMDKYNTEFSEWLSSLEGLAEEEEEEGGGINSTQLFDRVMFDDQDSLEYDLIDYITIPEDSEVLAFSSAPEVAEAVIFDEQTLIITPYSSGVTQITIEVTTEDNKKLIYLINIVVADFYFILDGSEVEEGRRFKYIRPQALPICDRTRTIDLSDYIRGSLPETAFFEIGADYSEDIAETVIDGHELIVTALKAGTTQVWIDLKYEGQRVDEALFEMQIAGDPDLCEEEPEPEPEPEEPQECIYLKVARIWVELCPE